ncbi:conserved hypothetical protein [Tenacibaculum maritimum]|uniref:hypothetical protein n=1 Tax=Tenacibaculum maritimum TaxID=107401 RepID=UPI0012E58C9A|nr:hypothetical protein [Tenacibaculum maritimum]CAA0248608.1 conserved hypothetical protein [Tenacibaculum maritimum]
MIKVYLDWNVLSGMKRGAFSEFRTIISDKEKFLTPYSTSHIGDILASHSEDNKQKNIIQEDLEYISLVTEDNCFYNSGEEVYLGFKNPQKLYKDRINTSDIFNDFSIDNLFAPLEEDDFLSPFVNILKELLKSIPLEKGFKDAFNDPKSSKEMDKIFPGLKDDLSFEGWFKYFGNLYNRMNETDDYKILRDSVQKIGISSGHFNENEDPFDIIEKAYKKLGINNPHEFKSQDLNKNAPDWFNEISNEYIMLDMHGYKQDKIKVTDKKKNTFKNLTEDSFHSAFASRCDFYITNDKRNIKKTKAVYSKLNIKTLVLTPSEFIDYYKEFLNAKTFGEHLQNLVSVIETGKGYNFLEKETYEEGKMTCLFGVSNYYFFNFFNQIRTCYSPNAPSFYILSKRHPARISYTAIKEISSLINNLINNLGIDNDKKGFYDDNEIKLDDEWEGRIWMQKPFRIYLKRINGWFQLYIYPNTQSEEQN